MFPRIILATSLVALATGSPARAGALAANDIFTQFNAVVFGNFSSTSDVEGRTVVGGNLTGGTTFNMKPAGEAASSFSALTVYGNATSGGNYNINNDGVTILGSSNATLNLNNGGTAYIGGGNTGNITISGKGGVAVIGANGGNINLNGGGTVYLGSNTGNIGVSGNSQVSINGNTTNNVNLNGSSTVLLNGSNSGTISMNGGSITYSGNGGNINRNGGATVTQGPVSITPPANTVSSFSTLFQSQLSTLSSQLNSVTPNSTFTTANNALSLNAQPDSTGTAVFDLNSSVFSNNLSTVTLNLNGATSAIINVQVDGCVQNSCAFSTPQGVNFSNPTSYATRVLWNFANATSLTFNGEFGGSVLAPLATVVNNSPIDGTLIAANYAGNGELHNYSYSGMLPGTGLTGIGNVSPSSARVPEPGTLAVTASALAGIALARRRRKSDANRLSKCPAMRRAT